MEGERGRERERKREVINKTTGHTPQKSAHSEHKSHPPILVRRNGATTATYNPANTVCDFVPSFDRLTLVSPAMGATLQTFFFLNVLMTELLPTLG